MTHVFDPTHRFQQQKGDATKQWLYKLYVSPIKTQMFIEHEFITMRKWSLPCVCKFLRNSAADSLLSGPTDYMWPDMWQVELISSASKSRRSFSDSNLLQFVLWQTKNFDMARGSAWDLFKEFLESTRDPSHACHSYRVELADGAIQGRNCYPLNVFLLF
jgi:hypothetical protein